MGVLIGHLFIANVLPSIATEGDQQLQSATNVRTPTRQLTWRTAHFHGHFPFDKSERERRESTFVPSAHEASVVSK